MGITPGSVNFIPLSQHLLAVTSLDLSAGERHSHKTLCPYQAVLINLVMEDTCSCHLLISPRPQLSVRLDPPLGSKRDPSVIDLPLLPKQSVIQIGLAEYLAETASWVGQTWRFLGASSWVALEWRDFHLVDRFTWLALNGGQLIELVNADARL